MDKDLYEILGVKNNATEADIRKAFHKLARQHHPDVNPGDKAAEQRFKEITLAYEVLKDPKKRAQYDQMRAAGANPFARRGTGGTWQQGGPFGDTYTDFGLGDLFEEIFGGGFGRRGGGRRSRAWQEEMFSRPGQDQETSLTISFLEAARGGERYIELTDGRKLTVKIPEGVADGSKIRLRGQGLRGIGDGPSGDLILALKVMPHPYFEREGNDILVQLPVTFAEAVLGGEVEVPTLDGKARLKIPAGVSSGQRLKMAGKGIRSADSKKPGDQFVEVLIKIPKKPDHRYRDLAKQLEGDGFDPRQGLY